MFIMVVNSRTICERSNIILYAEFSVNSNFVLLYFKNNTTKKT